MDIFGAAAGLVAGSGAGVMPSFGDASSGDLYTGVTVGGVVGSPLRPRSWVDHLPALIVAGALAWVLVAKFGRGK